MPQATKKAACCRKKPRSGENSTRSVPSRQGHRRKAEKLLRQQQKESRRRAAKDLIGLVRSCRLGVLIRGLQNLESSLWEGFNFVRAKPPLRRAESRFGKPRNSLHRETVLFFSLVRKERGVPQRFANLWTPGTIQISARFMAFAEMTGGHQVTGRAGKRNLSGYRR